jgi:CheY-like chemotaxis protein
MNQQVICEHLTRVGLKTTVAENGKIGVEIIQRRREKGEKQFDLIFMDIHMPVMDGVETAVKIIELETGIPIIAMTANIMSSDMEVYQTSGMHDCIGKPFTSQELWRCLLKYLTPLSSGAAQKNARIEADMEFQNLLRPLFLSNNQKKYEEIAGALEAGDIKLAHRLAHTLKSNAAQLGKVLLQQAAALVEQQLKEGENLVTPEQLAALEKELSAVLAEFETEG